MLLLLLLLSRVSRVRLCVTPRSWDSPGKNTGVGCHFLLQCMKVKSESEVAQSCLNLSDPMDCSPPGSSIHGIFQARVLEWVVSAFSEDTLLYMYKQTGDHLLNMLHFNKKGEVSIFLGFYFTSLDVLVKYSLTCNILMSILPIFLSI